MHQYLALDMGAESGRLMAVSIGEQISTSEIYRFQTPVATDRRGRRAWDLPKIIDEITIALTNAAKTGEYLALAVDTWGLDFGLLDANGAVIDMPVSHRDHRTDGMLERAFSLVGRNRLHYESGCQLLEVNSIYQLLAISEQTPDEFEKAKYILFMPDLVLYALTGVIGTEYTIATTSGLYDVVNDRWATNLAKDLNIPPELFGQVQNPGSIRGELKKELQDKTGIGPITCIATASHDTAAAVFATPLVTPGSAYISSGTWSLMGVELEKPVVNQTTLEGRLTNEGGYNRSIRLLRNIMGLWLIQEVRRDLKERGTDLTYAQLVAEAEKLSDPFASLIYVDASIFIHAGNMIDRIQRFCRQTNQKVPTTPGELAQTVFASLALQYAKTCDDLEICSKLPMPAINIVGGGSQNHHLCQLTANISGKEVVAGPVEATAMGNAMVSAIALGNNPNLVDAKSARALISRSNLGLKSFKPKGVIDSNTIAQIRTRYQKLSMEDMR
jgi:sugar (pentulose or hexulose) kinase